MSKYDLAQYLVNLHTLMEAQSKVAASLPSTTLADEYGRAWSELKTKIKEEREDEARKRDDARERTEAGAPLTSSQPRRG